MNIPINAVKAVIVKQGKILFLQRNKETRDTNNWDLPGGLVEKNETEEEALIREVAEEISNIEIKVVSKLKGDWQFLRPKDNKIVRVQNYLCEIVSSIPEKLALSEEHSDYKWIDISEIQDISLKDTSLTENILKNKKYY